MLDKKQVSHVAKLARLKVSEAELDALGGVLSAVLDNFQQITSLDTRGVTPLVTPIDLTISLRPDENSRDQNSDAVLDCASEKTGRLYRVPPVV